MAAKTAKGGKPAAGKPAAGKVNAEPKRTSIADLADELSVNYFKPRDLMDAEVEFTLLSSSIRKSSNFGHDEVVFELVTAEGETGHLSMRSSTRREKLARLVNGKGPIGPLVMVQSEDDSKGNPAWCFADPKQPDQLY